MISPFFAMLLNRLNAKSPITRVFGPRTTLAGGAPAGQRPGSAFTEFSLLFMVGLCRLCIYLTWAILASNFRPLSRSASNERGLGRADPLPARCPQPKKIAAPDAGPSQLLRSGRPGTGGLASKGSGFRSCAVVLQSDDGLDSVAERVQQGQVTGRFSLQHGSEGLFAIFIDRIEYLE